jgi:hypothetical protein
MGKKVKPFNPTNKTVAKHYKELLALDNQTVEGTRIEPHSKMDRPDGAAVRFPWWEVYLQSQESIRQILGGKGYRETFRSQFPQYKNDTGAKP